MLNHFFFFVCFFLLFFSFFFLRLGLGQRRAVVIIGRWLLPSLVDTGDICCHYWQHILVWLWIWVRSQNCGCLVTWFCYQLIAKPGNKTAAVLRSDPYDLFTRLDILCISVLDKVRRYCQFLTLGTSVDITASPAIVHLMKLLFGMQEKTLYFE